MQNDLFDYYDIGGYIPNIKFFQENHLNLVCSKIKDVEVYLVRFNMAFLNSPHYKNSNPLGIGKSPEDAFKDFIDKCKDGKLIIPDRFNFSDGISFPEDIHL